MYNKNDLTVDISRFLFGYDAHPGFEHVGLNGEEIV